MWNIGLVLGGGGAKGSYEAGAWQAICESGLDKYIKIFSGTSIGAINCALFQICDYKEAAYIWLNYNLNKFFLTDGVNLKDIIKSINKLRRGKEIEFDGLFSRDGLIYLLDKSGIDKLEDRILDFYMTVSNITELPEENRYLQAAVDWYNGKKPGFTQHIHLTKADKNFIVDMLLATSAIPVVYPMVEIGGQYYVDGGLNDNLPITPIYNRDVNKIIAVSCERINYKNLKKTFPACQIMLIQPSKYLGNMLNGTFNFNRNKLRESYRLGYYDALKAIKKNNFYINLAEL